MIFVAICWTFSSPSVLNWGAQGWTQHFRYCLTSAERRRRVTSVNLLSASCIPGCRWPILPQGYTAGSWSTRGCSSPVAGLGISLCTWEEVPSACFSSLSRSLSTGATIFCVSCSSWFCAVWELVEGVLCAVVWSLMENNLRPSTTPMFWRFCCYLLPNSR